MTAELTYRKSAIAGASTIGLMIVLFDTLAGNLRLAATALRNNDIETRCHQLNHAALVLGQLESWVDLKSGGESAETLSRFYAYLRSNMMEAAGRKSAELLETQIEMLLHVRTAWHQLDVQLPVAMKRPEKVPEKQLSAPFTRGLETESDRIPFSLSL